MYDRKKETSEFDARIAEMAARLAVRKVTVERTDYAAEAFGSWQIVAGTEKKKLDFSYEGKESYLRFRDAAIVPRDHRDFQHKSFRTWHGEDPLVFVEEELARQFPVQ